MVVAAELWTTFGVMRIAPLLAVFFGCASQAPAETTTPEPSPSEPAVQAVSDPFLDALPERTRASVTASCPLVDEVGFRTCAHTEAAGAVAALGVEARAELALPVLAALVAELRQGDLATEAKLHALAQRARIFDALVESARHDEANPPPVDGDVLESNATSPSGSEQMACSASRERLLLVRAARQTDVRAPFVDDARTRLRQQPTESLRTCVERIRADDPSFAPLDSNDLAE